MARHEIWPDLVFAPFPLSTKMSQHNVSQIFSGRYQIQSELGEGGIGKVYRAHDRWICKDVALKTLCSHTISPSQLSDFKNEFLQVSGLRHPGVVEVFDFGHSQAKDPGDKSVPYFTMEFVEGTSLAQACSNLHDLQIAQSGFRKLGRLIWQICDILEFLHLREIVHCDLKPENIKITKRAFGPKILDFGLSERLGSRSKPEAKGTLPYMAPEMFKREPLDQRTDLYSLGVVLYEVVTGKLPFASDDPVKIVSAHLEMKPKAPFELNDHIPSPLNELILRLLEKSPADRPGSAGEVKKTLESAFAIDSRKKIAEGFPSENTLLAHLSSGLLVGRESELARMKEDMEEATRHRGRTFFVSGEQGVGKTSLLRQLRTECQLEGIVFVDSTCLENQTSAYQPVMEILGKLEPYVESGCPESLLNESREFLDWSKNDLSSRGDQASFHRKMTRLLTSISQSFPFVMVVENLQWVDPSTLQFLQRFQQQIDQSRVFLCCTVCRERLSKTSPTTDSINLCLASEEKKHLRLERFDASGTESLIVSKFPRNRFEPEFFSWVYQRTSGNPFFVLELLRYLLEEGLISLQDLAWVANLKCLEKYEVPATIESALMKNLKRYPHKVTDFLDVLSVTGKRFTLQLLNGLALLPEHELSEILSSLTQDRLLDRKEEAGGQRTWYEFANQSLQNLLYQGLDLKERIDWHRKVAGLLEKESTGEDSEAIFEIAHHYLKGEMPQKAYHFALLSADKMQQMFANEEALTYLENAIQISSAIPDQREAQKKKTEALMKRAGFCVKVGELNQAEKDYLAIVEQMENWPDLKTLVSAYNGLGEVCRLKHDHQKGISYLKQAMTVHQKLNDPFELAHTLSFMGLLYWIDSQYDTALEYFHQALEIDRRLGNHFYEANTLNNMGLVYWSKRQYSRALKHFTNALAVYRDLDNKEWLARTQNNIGATLFEMGDFEKCVEHFLESYKINEQTKNEREMAFNLENLSEAYRKMGRHSEALDYGLRGLKLATEIDFTDRVGRILKGLGIIHLELGQYHQAGDYLQQAAKVADDIEDKELKTSILLDRSRLAMILNDSGTVSRHLEEAENIIRSLDDQKSMVILYQIKSHLEKVRGQPEQALQLLKKALIIAGKLNLGEQAYSLSLDCAQIYLDRGNLGKAEEVLDRIGRMGLERYASLECEFHLIRGKIEWVKGQPSSARRSFEAGIRKAQKVNSREVLWSIHHHLGQLLLFLRDAEGAYREMKRAADILKQLSEEIADREMKQSYLNESRKQKLLADLKTVAKELIGEPRLT